MESSTRLTWFSKHGFLLPAFICIAAAIENFVFREGMIVNGEPRTFDYTQVAFMVAIGLIFVILWLFVKDKVVKVKLGGQNITIYESGEIRTVNWLDVERLNQVMRINPPIYKLWVKGDETYYLFVSEGFSLSFGIGAVDLSDMGSFIKKKKRELGI